MPASKSASPFAPLATFIRRHAEGAGRVLHVNRDVESGGTSSVGGLVEESFVRRLERLSLITRGLASQGIAGEHRSRRHAGSAEFSDYRPYTPGDDFRRIDWNAYARLDGLFLKQTEAKVEVPIHLLVDCSQSMNWGIPNKLGFARRLAGAIGYLSLARFDAVTVTTFSDDLHERFPLTRGKAQALRMLAHLDRAPIGPSTRLEFAMRRYCESGGVAGVAFLLTDLVSEDNWQQGIVQLLGRGLEVVVIHVVSPQESTPDVEGEVELVDAETGDVVEVVVGEQARRTYQRRAQEWFDEVDEFCRRSEVRYLRLETTLELEDIFLSVMRQRRIVR
jgi:uncharacterized protein (DUF58 family)